MQYSSLLEMKVKNVVWMMGDDFYTFQELLDKLKECNIIANNRYVDRVLEDMIHYSWVKRYGIYFKNQPIE